MRIQLGNTVVGKLITRLSYIGASISSVLLLVMLALTLYSVFLRYFLRSPAAWVNEWVAFLMVPVAALALAETQRHRSHVSVDLLVLRLPRRSQAIFFTITTGVMAAYSFFMARATLHLALESWEQGMRSIISRVPLGTVQIMLTIGFALLFVQAAYDCFGGPPAESDSPHLEAGGHGG